jgi:hypothetical protein
VNFFAAPEHTMATSSLLGIDSDNLPPSHNATGIDSLGPSDASDSGSDSAGAYSDEPDSDTDRFGTGERSSADLSETSSAQDILPDHIEAMGGDAEGSAGDGPDAPDEGMTALRADGIPQDEDQEGDGDGDGGGEEAAD